MKFSSKSAPKIYSNLGGSFQSTTPPKIRIYEVGAGEVVLAALDQELVSIAGTPQWLWDGESKWTGGVPSTEGQYVYLIVDDQGRVAGDGQFSLGPSDAELQAALKPTFRYPGALERPLNISNNKPYRFWLTVKDNLDRPVSLLTNPEIRIKFLKPENNSLNFGDDPGNINTQRDTQFMVAEATTGVYYYDFTINGSTPKDLLEVRMKFSHDGKDIEDNNTIEIFGSNEFNTSRVQNSGLIIP